MSRSKTGGGKEWLFSYTIILTIIISKMNDPSPNDNIPVAGKPAPTIIFGNTAINLSEIDIMNPDPELMAQLDARIKKKDKNSDRAEKRRLMFNRSPRRQRK